MLKSTGPLCHLSVSDCHWSVFLLHPYKEFNTSENCYLRINFLPMHFLKKKSVIDCSNHYQVIGESFHFLWKLYSGHVVLTSSFFWEPCHLRTGGNFINDLYYSHLSNGATRTYGKTLVISQGYATSGNKTNFKVMFSSQSPQLHYQQMFALQSILAVNKEQNTHHLHFKSISILFML